VLASFVVAATNGLVPVLVLGVVLGIAAIPLWLRRAFRTAAEEGSGAALDAAPRGLSRRQAMTRLGLVGAGAALPLVGVPALVDSFRDEAGAAPATGPGGRTRQWGMLIDLRRCDGCQSQGTAPQCTTACIEGHFVPQPMEWIEVYEGELDGGGTQFIPTPCQQCQNPPCVNVCPVGATFSAPEGPVLIDQDRCIGCRICMAACPYDRRFFNWGDPPVPPEAQQAEYDLELQVPATKGTVMKCDFCPDMVRSGTLPYCIQGCPHRAIYYGDLEEDLATNGRELVSVSRYLANNDAFRLKEDLGTQPRVFYIPGHGEEVGRDPTTGGFLPIRWPWTRLAEGSSTWSR
jgi:molybdopterin-containing oxidoreductase family iron-sulfur binding subunit